LVETADEISILGYRLHPRTGEEVVAEITAAVADHRRLIMANVNMHGMAVMFDNPGMARLLSQDNACVTIDSMPVLFLANLLGHRLPRSKRTTSLEFYDAMFRRAAAAGWRVGYVGGEQTTLERGLDVLRARFPGLDIEGRAGYFDLHDQSAGSVGGEILSWLRARRNNLVIVGMGMPRQEAWIELTQDLIEPCVFLTAGAYLDYQVGAQRASPRWIGQIGFEWLYRLVWSPRRLAYRYLVEPFVLAYRLLTREHPQRHLGQKTRRG
jgi:N-acetylglucosaminyldiphosphoundecaprenol N-acetyl-beta-D-mannosaminyltransferase